MAVVGGAGHLQNHVFAPETVARSGFDGEDHIERERATFALARAGDGGSLEARGDAEYHLVLEYKIGGPLTYVTASTHCKRFDNITVDHVLLNLSHVTRIDLDGIAALEVTPSEEAAASGCCTWARAAPRRAAGGFLAMQLVPV